MSRNIKLKFIRIIFYITLTADEAVCLAYNGSWVWYLRKFKNVKFSLRNRKILTKRFQTMPFVCVEICEFTLNSFDFLLRESFIKPNYQFFCCSRFFMLCRPDHRLQSLFLQITKKRQIYKFKTRGPRFESRHFQILRPGSWPKTWPLSRLKNRSSCCQFAIFVGKLSPVIYWGISIC